MKDKNLAHIGTEDVNLKDMLEGFDDRFQKLTEEIRRNANLRDKFLDIDCGEGKIWQLFPEYDITGLDFSKDNLKKAKKYVKPVFGNAEKLPFKAQSFNLVVASEILEHLFEPEKTLKEIDRVLKAGGRAIITFPNTGSLQFRLSLALWGRNPALNYPENVRHIRFFNLSDIREMLEGTRLKIRKVRGVSFLSFHPMNFGVYIPVPRKIRVLGGDIFPKLSLGCVVVLHKRK